MGRAGLEPATLGLKVRREPLQPGAPSRKVLQQSQAGAATNCSEMRVAETSPYSQPYSQPLSSQTKPKVVGVASVTEPPAPIYGLPADRPSSVQREPAWSLPARLSIDLLGSRGTVIVGQSVLGSNSEDLVALQDLTPFH